MGILLEMACIEDQMKSRAGSKKSRSILLEFFYIIVFHNCAHAIFERNLVELGQHKIIQIIFVQFNKVGN